MSTKCVKCENTSFELATSEVRGSRYKVNFVRCTQCKTAVGVMGYYDPVFFIRKLAEKLHINLDD